MVGCHSSASALPRVRVRFAAVLALAAGAGGPAVADAAGLVPAGPPVGSTLSQLDAGRSDDGGLQLGLGGSLSGERLLWSGRLHAGRQQNRLGSQVLPGSPFHAFSEIGLAYRLRHDLSVGAEYRFAPNNRQPAGPFGYQARDGAWKNLFIAWSVNHSLVLTAAHVDLGSLPRTPGGGRQAGPYFSAELRY